MRVTRLFTAAGLLAAAGAAIAARASPFPAGYDAAYRAFVATLSPKERQSTWLTELTGVTAPPSAMKFGGKPVTYLFACKNHSCDTDNVNIFLAADRKSFRAILKIGGKQRLLGGAGPAELACVRKLEASGGVATAC